MPWPRQYSYNMRSALTSDSTPPAGQNYSASALLSRRGRSLAVAALLTLSLVAACGTKGVVQVTIPAGSSVREATDSLHKAGLVSLTALFRLYVKMSGRDHAVRPGTFVIARGSSWNTILDTLTRGRGLSYSITIPEGLTLAAIESLLVEKLKLPPDSVARAARDSSLRASHNVSARTLEGYLFPDTYSFPLGVTASSAVTATLERFETLWDTTWNSRLGELSLTRHEIVTLASIIEREAVVAEERPVISAVYHNRLRIGMALQADPTVQYANGQHKERVLLKDLQVNSPYNTYKHPGLPPGPIASPGTQSIRAALFPADVRFLYFVAHPDGHHEFRNTYAEHLAAKRQMERARKGG